MEPVAPGSAGIIRDVGGERKQQRKSKQLASLPCSWTPSTLRGCSVPTGLAKVERVTQAPAKYGAQPGAAPPLLLLLRRC